MVISSSVALCSPMKPRTFPVCCLTFSVVRSILYRYDGEPDTADAVRGVSAWVGFFVGAAMAAAEQSRSVLEDITALQRDWERRLATDRISRGVRPRPRIDSATSQIFGILPSAPVLTSRTVQRVLGVSPKAALEALAELTAAGILQTRRISPSATAYHAGELLDLITFAERRLASTKFDTRAAVLFEVTE